MSKIDVFRNHWSSYLSEENDVIDQIVNVRWLVWLVMACIGCSSNTTGDVVATVPVNGRISFQGKPLEYYQVALFPENSQRPAMGTSNEHGEFTVGTNTQDDGAITGTHRVAVNYVGPPNVDPEFGMNDFSEPQPPKIKIPAKFNDPTKSGLTVDVSPGGLTEWELKLQ